MARPSEEQLRRLAVEIAVQRLVELAGVELEHTSTGLIGTCRLCSTTKALTVDAEANQWSCSSCGRGGGPVEWVMAVEGVSLTLAVEILREGLPLSGPSGRRPAKRSTRTKLPPLESGLPDEALLAEVVAFYHRTLLETPEAHVFLEQRGLADAELVAAFRLGFANRTLGYRIPHRRLIAGEALRAQLQSIGVLAPSGHEAFRGSIVVPITDLEARVVQLYGRKVAPKFKPDQPRHVWLSGERPLFNPQAMVAHDEVVVCGSVIDALTMWTAGFRHVLAVDGDLTAGHVGQLVEHQVRRVLLALRRTDDDTTATAAAGRLLAAGVESFRVVWPSGMDVNDFARASHDPTDAIATALRGATWMGKGPAPSGRRQPPPEAAGASTEADHDESAPADVVEDLDGRSDDVLASPVPAGPSVEPEAVLDGDAMRLTVGERRWRVRGLAKNTSFDVLRVQVMVSVAPAPRGAGFHVDSFDLYSARARQVFVRDASVEIAVDEKILKRDLGRVLMAAEAVVEEAIRQAQEPETPVVELDADERANALELLRDAKLIDRITDDFARAGMVGESTNCLVGYLAAVSRLLERPLAVVVQSTSAAGKSALMDAVLDFVPDEARVSFSAMTGQSLYYMGEHDLAHKVLAIAEEEGAERASYALKLLQSEGQLSIASTGKDTSTGKLITHPYHVEGPAAIFLTTTAIDIDEELLNRCIVLSVNEETEQTRAIHDRQRRARTLEGLLAGSESAAVIKQHQDAQRLLEPLAVVNPFAHRLGFADGATRTRRDHVKYLTLIEVIALLHQHQRKRQTAVTADGHTVTYIEATLDDIALANRLAHEVLGRSLDDLPPQTRRLLDALDGMVGEIAREQAIDRDRVRFTRRQVRERIRFGDTQLKVHLARLVDLELVWAHRAERAGSFVYELVWDSAMSDQRRFLPGLVDVSALRNKRTQPAEPAATTADRSGANGHRSGRNGARSAPGRAGRPGRSGSGRNTADGANGQPNGKKRGSGNGQAPKRAVAAATSGRRTRTTVIAADPPAAGDRSKRSRS